MKALFIAKLISTGEWVEGTYHYSNDGKYHYILNRECFLERTYDSSNEMALKKEEVHLVDGDSVIQISDNLQERNQMLEARILKWYSQTKDEKFAQFMGITKAREGRV